MAHGKEQTYATEKRRRTEEQMQMRLMISSSVFFGNIFLALLDGITEGGGGWPYVNCFHVGAMRCDAMRCDVL